MTQDDMKAKVSVIIPVYNAEKYIRDSVESVVHQTYSNWELILVDDGSKDASGKICDDYAKLDSRIFSFHKQNGGASSARNFGMRNAKGEYVYFLDCDDYLELDALQILVSLAIDKSIDCIYFEAYNFSETNTIVAKTNGFTFHASYPILDGKSLILQLIHNKDYHAGPVLYFMKASILKDMWFEEGIMMEDELFSFKLLLACNTVLCLRRKLYRRRLREGSVMTTQGQNIFRFLSISKVLKEVISIYKQITCKETSKYLERIGILWLTRYDELTVSEKETIKERFSELKEDIKRSNYFGSFQLRIRFLGYMPWFLLTMPKRLFRTLRLTIIQ